MTRDFLPAVDLLGLQGEGDRFFAVDVPLPVRDPDALADHWLPRLSQAILADALKCLGARSSDGPEAWEWVVSDADYCFSFTTVCVVLQLNAEAVRRAVHHRFAPGRARPGRFSQLPRHAPAGPSVRRARPRVLVSSSPGARTERVSVGKTRRHAEREA
jgi:hypothetical protein